MIIISEDGTQIVLDSKIERFEVFTEVAPKAYCETANGVRMYADTSDKAPVEMVHTYKLCAYLIAGPLVKPPVCLMVSSSLQDVEVALNHLLEAMSRHSTSSSCCDENYRLATSPLKPIGSSTNLDKLKNGSKLDIAVLLNRCKWSNESVTNIIKWLEAQA